MTIDFAILFLPPQKQSSYIEHGDSNPVVGPIDNLWGESYRFSPLWSNGPRLHGGNPIGFVPASRVGVYIKSKYFVSFPQGIGKAHRDDISF
jgi:hypothetical protein